jgi:hypothetical protein
VDIAVNKNHRTGETIGSWVALKTTCSFATRWKRLKRRPEVMSKQGMLAKRRSSWEEDNIAEPKFKA